MASRAQPKVGANQPANIEHESVMAQGRNSNVRSCEEMLPTACQNADVIFTTAGDLLVNGIQLGNIWIGVQPALGVEGDPMRMLFERDLTPCGSLCL